MPALSTYIKVYSLLFLCLPLAKTNWGQAKRVTDWQQGLAKNKLPEYTTDSCLSNFLTAISDADSSNQRFPPTHYYYDLSFANYDFYRQIIIVPKRWPNKLPDYVTGIIEIEKMLFVCNGNISKDSLFKRTGIYYQYSLPDFSPSKFDTLDANYHWPSWEKSPTAFVAQFNFCAGLPIDMYVDVQKKIEGYAIGTRK